VGGSLHHNILIGRKLLRFSKAGCFHTEHDWEEGSKHVACKGNQQN